MTDDEYNIIVEKVHQYFQEPMKALQTSQDSIKTALDLQLMKLKGITEKAVQMHLHPVFAGTGGSSPSMPSTSHAEILTLGRSTTVHIPTTSMKFPLSLLQVQIRAVGPIEVNLAAIPLETLQMVQSQVFAELRERELETY